jgi:hypothetical protein
VLPRANAAKIIISSLWLSIIFYLDLPGYPVIKKYHGHRGQILPMPGLGGEEVAAPLAGNLKIFSLMVLNKAVNQISSG